MRSKRDAELIQALTERIIGLEREVAHARAETKQWHADACAFQARAASAIEQLDEARALLREWRDDFSRTPLGERLRATERVLRLGVTVEVGPVSVSVKP